MELPDLDLLVQLFHKAQSNKAIINGYACFTCDTYRGVGAFCFCDDLEDWKDLFPAILFMDALIYKDYEMFEEEDFEKLKAIYLKYEDAEWNDSDFIDFQCDFSEYLGSFEIAFLGKVSQLLETDTEDDFIERLQQSFGDNPMENEEEFFEFLNKYTN
jgi:hypothetical protein